MFPKSSIRRLGRHRGIFSVGLRIEHTEQSFLSSLSSGLRYLLDFSFPEVEANLESLGYDIAA